MLSFLDIVFMMFVVAYIISKLYALFGTHGSDKSVRVVIKTTDKNVENKVVEIANLIKEKGGEGKICVSEIKDLPEPDKSLLQIPFFNKDNFLQGACRVFECVFRAFNSGNIDGVRPLMSKKVWDGFNQALQIRKENNWSAEVDFICFEKSEIKDVRLLKNTAKIIVEFVSEQINILRDAEGKVIEGDENFVQKITDCWTFERALDAKTNQWSLVSTKKVA